MASAVVGERNVGLPSMLTATSGRRVPRPPRCLVQKAGSQRQATEAGSSLAFMATKCLHQGIALLATDWIPMVRLSQVTPARLDLGALLSLVGYFFRNTPESSC